MARRAGSLATERTDYSDRRLFPGHAINVPLPFARLEDFVFTAHNSLLPPTAKMVALIDPSRRPEPQDVPAGRLEEGASAMLEAELTHCVRAKPLADTEQAGPKLRMAILWGRFSEVAATEEQRARARSYEQQYFNSAVRDLFLELDPNFATFGYRYGWGATQILERFAETAGVREIARQAWDCAAQAHTALAGTVSDRRVRRTHTQMAAIDIARGKAVYVARDRMLVGHAEQDVVSLQGHNANQADRHF